MIVYFKRLWIITVYFQMTLDDDCLFSNDFLLWYDVMVSYLQTTSDYYGLLFQATLDYYDYHTVLIQCDVY